jgi:hypothetical protein
MRANHRPENVALPALAKTIASLPSPPGLDVRGAQTASREAAEQLHMSLVGRRMMPPSVLPGNTAAAMKSP